MADDFQPLPLNRDTLVSLLAEGTERPGLDFKQECDLNDKGHLVELVKDLGANQLEGGYIIIGADDQGKPSPGFTEEQAGLFDQATLHSKIEPYLADGFDVRSTALQTDEHWFAIVCIVPHPDILAPFKRDGAYERDGKPKKPFRQGDIFARHGTKSERANVEDIRKARERIRREEREAARGDFQEDLQRVTQTITATQANAAAPLGAINWQLDTEALTGAVLEQLRRDDRIPITLLLQSARREAGDLIEAERFDELNALLDRLVCLTATFTTVDETALAEDLVRTLGDIYNQSFDKDGLDRRDLGIQAPELRLRVIGRAWALGALAVRKEHWTLVQALATQQPAAHDADYWQTWLFHGLVMANRADLLKDEGQRRATPILVVAQEHIARLECLHPDLRADDERIVTSLCQFDFLACTAVLGLPGGKQSGSFLANFAFWFSSRTDPIVVRLLEDPALRESIFPREDRELAEALMVVAENARAMRASDFLSGGWGGYQDDRIKAFLEENLPD